MTNGPIRINNELQAQSPEHEYSITVSRPSKTQRSDFPDCVLLCTLRHISKNFLPFALLSCIQNTRSPIKSLSCLQAGQAWPLRTITLSHPQKEMFSKPPQVSHKGLNLPFVLIYFVSECLYGHDKDISTVKSNKEELNFICNRLTKRLRANEWKQDNRSQSFSPGLHLLELGSPTVSIRPPSLSLSLSRLCNPLKHPSFLAVISFPMLSASACSLSLSLFVTPTFYLSPPCFASASL